MIGKLWIINDFSGVPYLLEFPEEIDIDLYKKEYDSILDPGNHPCGRREGPFCEGSGKHKNWRTKIRYRDEELVKKYGGKFYNMETFVGYLIKEKSAKLINCCYSKLSVYHL